MGRVYTGGDDIAGIKLSVFMPICHD